MARNISWAKILEAERLDITLWSDDSPVSNAVNALAKELKRVVTFKRMTWQRKKAIRIVILNLYLRWLEDPPGLVSYSRNKSNYTIPARYNPAQIGYGPIISVIDGLWKLGYIDKTTNGYYARFGGKSWISRMAPKPKLIRLLEKTYGVDGSMIGVHSKAETIILRDADKKEVDYSNRRYRR